MGIPFARWWKTFVGISVKYYHFVISITDDQRFEFPDTSYFFWKTFYPLTLLRFAVYSFQWLFIKHRPVCITKNYSHMSRSTFHSHNWISILARQFLTPQLFSCVRLIWLVVPCASFTLHISLGASSYDAKSIDEYPYEQSSQWYRVFGERMMQPIGKRTFGALVVHSLPPRPYGRSS